VRFPRSEWRIRVAEKPLGLGSPLRLELGEPALALLYLAEVVAAESRFGRSVNGVPLDEIVGPGAEMLTDISGKGVEHRGPEGEKDGAREQVAAPLGHQQPQQAARVQLRPQRGEVAIGARRHSELPHGRQVKPVPVAEIALAVRLPDLETVALRLANRPFDAAVIARTTEAERGVGLGKREHEGDAPRRSGHPPGQAVELAGWGLELQPGSCVASMSERRVHERGCRATPVGEWACNGGMR
jgi:hypothetical protein